MRPVSLRFKQQIIMLCVMIIGFIAAAYYAWSGMKPAPPSPLPILTYPSGVWPPRLQSFADRLVEARAGANGRVTLYFLDAQTHKFRPVDNVPTLEGEAVSVNGDAVPVHFKADLPPGQVKGGSWCYIGQVPMERVQTNKWGLFGLRVTVPLGDTNHSVRWRDEQLLTWIDSRHRKKDVAMPAPPTSADERKLFLTPGGKYTQADIVANSNLTASTRYGGMMAAHSLNPTKGQLICPITKTLANPRFTWVVDGKTYRFCCPPCIAEFVRQAKTQPATIKSPAAYVAR